MSGRLQTDRDQDRVLDGLEGAAAGSGAVFDRQTAAAKLAALDKRVFLLHNVHDDAPHEFQTRWALSYLAGPLTRVQIRKLMSERRQEVESERSSQRRRLPRRKPKTASRPLLPAGIGEYFAPVRSMRPEGAALVCYPALLAMVRTRYEDNRNKIDYVREYGWMTTDRGWPDRGFLGAIERDSPRAGRSRLSEPHPETAEYGELPQAALKKANYGGWQQRTGQLDLFRAAPGAVEQPRL